MHRRMRPRMVGLSLMLVMAIPLLSGCIGGEKEEVAHEGRWGIYSLDLETQETELIHGFDQEIATIRLNPQGDMFAFSMNIGGEENEHGEICVMPVSGGGYEVLTSNDYWDLYPTWSDDGAKIAFLSWRDEGLDIYVIDSNGGSEALFYDSGHHDADIHWAQGKLAFTSQSCIWIMDDDASSVMRVTSPPNAGEWGNANLPFGDYDPQLHPFEELIVFERLEDDESPHGNYDIYSVGFDGTGEKRLTDTGYSQGFASWSHSGDRIVFLVAAIGEDGVFDVYMMDKDGLGLENMTPDYYPPEFLCHAPIFSSDDSMIYFVGEWWE